MFVEPGVVTTEEAERAEFCIFGSGPAGLTLAVKLAEAGRRVVLIEAGSQDYEDWSQAHYEGTVIGDNYYALDESRLRMFGGSSNHWAGHCIPLEAHDYQARNYVPNTGWPISIEDMAPYLAEACDIVEIPNDFPEVAFSDVIRKTRFQWSPPVLFGEKYNDMIAGSTNLDVVLETALIGFEQEGAHIRAARLQTHGGQEFRLEADTFVMCMGGIENSRILLWANEQNNRALIKNHDLLGRYWMEHPNAQLGEVLFDRLTPDFFHNREATFALTRAHQEQAEILNASLQVEKYSYSRTKALLADIACVAPELGARLLHGLGRNLVCGARLKGQWEQAPVADNRVVLGREKDAFGIPKTELHWRRSELDRKTIVETTRIFARELARKDLGRVRLMRWVEHDEAIPDEDLMAIWHHIGGTRMSDDPAQGIVDRNLKAHGLGNLYIGGSSVFPDGGGYANVTLTIVQMSLRLADHLKQVQ